MLRAIFGPRSHALTKSRGQLVFISWTLQNYDPVDRYVMVHATLGPGFEGPLTRIPAGSTTPAELTFAVPTHLADGLQFGSTFVMEHDALGGDLANPFFSQPHDYTVTVV